MRGRNHRGSHNRRMEELLFNHGRVPTHGHHGGHCSHIVRESPSQFSSNDQSEMVNMNNAASSQRHSGNQERDVIESRRPVTPSAPTLSELLDPREGESSKKNQILIEKFYREILQGQSRSTSSDTTTSSSNNIHSYERSQTPANFGMSETFHSRRILTFIELSKLLKSVNPLYLGKLIQDLTPYDLENLSSLTLSDIITGIKSILVDVDQSLGTPLGTASREVGNPEVSHFSGASTTNTMFESTPQTTETGSSSLPTNHGSSSLPTNHESSSLPTNYESSSLPTNHGSSSLPTNHESSSLPTNYESSSLPTNHGSSSLPTNHGSPSLPTNHGSSSLPTNHEPSSLPTNHGSSSLPTNHESSSLPTNHGSSSLPTNHESSSLPTNHGPQPAGQQLDPNLFYQGFDAQHPILPIIIETRIPHSYAYVNRDSRLAQTTVGPIFNEVQRSNNSRITENNGPSGPRRENITVRNEPVEQQAVSGGFLPFAGFVVEEVMQNLSPTSVIPENVEQQPIPQPMTVGPRLLCGNCHNVQQRPVETQLPPYGGYFVGGVPQVMQPYVSRYLESSAPVFQEMSEAQYHQTGVYVVGNSGISPSVGRPVMKNGVAGVGRVEGRNAENVGPNNETTEANTRNARHSGETEMNNESDRARTVYQPAVSRRPKLCVHGFDAPHPLIPGMNTQYPVLDGYAWSGEYIPACCFVGLNELGYENNYSWGWARVYEEIPNYRNTSTGVREPPRETNANNQENNA